MFQAFPQSLSTYPVIIENTGPRGEQQQGLAETLNMSNTEAQTERDSL